MNLKYQITFIFKWGTFISYPVVQCLSLLHSFAKHSQNPKSVHCRFVQICLIYLAYWWTKHWKYLVLEKDAKADMNLVELKFAKLSRSENNFLILKLKSKFTATLFANWFQKHLMHSLFITYENDEWCRFVVYVVIGPPSVISFCCVCFVSFYFFLYFHEFYYFLRYWGKFGDT